jgi:hypothetical protein
VVETLGLCPKVTGARGISGSSAKVGSPDWAIRIRDRDRVRIGLLGGREMREDLGGAMVAIERNQEYGQELDAPDEQQYAKGSRYSL